MAEAKLTITTNAQQVTDELKQVSDGLKDVTKSQKELIDTAKQSAGGYEKTAGAIKDTQKAADDLRMSLQEQREWDKRALQNQMDMYTKVVRVRREQTKEEIDNLQKIGKETDELSGKVENFTKKWGAVGIAIVLVTKVFKDVVKAIADTTIGMKALTAVGEFWKQLTYNIAVGNFNMAESFRVAAATAIKINEQRDKELKDIVAISKLRKEYNRLYFESSDLMQSDVERFQTLNQAMLAHNILIDKEVEKTKDQLRIVQLQRQNRFNSYKLKKQEAELIAQVIDLEGRAFTETKRLERQMTGLLKGFFDDYNDARASMDKAIQQWEEDWAAERLENQKKYQDKSLELLEKYNQARLEMLSGQEYLEALRDLSLQEIAQLKKDLEALGPITKEQEEMFATLGMGVMKSFYTGVAEEITIGQKDIEKLIIPSILATVNKSSNTLKSGFIGIEAELQKSYIQTFEGDEFDFSVWDKLGLNEDDKQDAIDALKDGARTVSNIIGDIFEQRVDDAGRRRDLMDTQISELQRDLDLEARLYEEGYANNVDAKKKELEELKKQREQAIKEEEIAIKKQKALDTITQTINLITASTEIFKSMSKIPLIGIPLAIGLIATMFGAFIAVKAKASQATKLAEGGYGDETGVIRGRSHAQGGEKFLDHVEVERGEAWGVLSRPASQKYGEIFHDMVSSFNKDQMPSFMPIANTVNVDNKGPNSRLDKVITEQRKLNQSILSQSQISHIGNKKIIKTGNKVRIVG